MWCLRLCFHFEYKIPAKAHTYICVYIYSDEFFKCMCVCVYDSPGNAEHHHTYDDHLQCSDDGGDEDIVQFAGAWNHVEHIVFFDITLGTSETGVTAGFTRIHTIEGERKKETG